MSAGSSAGATSGVERERKKKKPGQIRRDKRCRTAFLERRRQAAVVAEAARTEETREVMVEKTVEIDTGAGETSFDVRDQVRKSSSTSSTLCTWDVGVEAPSTGSLQQSMSVDESDSEKGDEPLDPVQTVEVKENNKWRISVESLEIEKLDELIKTRKDSKVFEYFSKAAGGILRLILSVDSVVKHGNILVLDVSIDCENFCIAFIENKHNWPTFVTNVKRVGRL